MHKRKESISIFKICKISWEVGFNVIRCRNEMTMRYKNESCNEICKDCVMRCACLKAVMRCKMGKV